MCSQEDMGMMTKLLAKPTLSSDRTFNPQSLPTRKKQHNSVPATTETRVENSELTVNSTATNRTRGHQPIPASILPMCRAKGCTEDAAFPQKFWWWAIAANRKRGATKLIVIDDSATRQT